MTNLMIVLRDNNINLRRNSRYTYTVDRFEYDHLMLHKYVDDEYF